MPTESEMKKLRAALKKAEKQCREELAERQKKTSSAPSLESSKSMESAREKCKVDSVEDSDERMGLGLKTALVDFGPCAGFEEASVKHHVEMRNTKSGEECFREFVRSKEESKGSFLDVVKAMNSGTGEDSGFDKLCKSKWKAAVELKSSGAATEFVEVESYGIEKSEEEEDEEEEEYEEEDYEEEEHWSEIKKSMKLRESKKTARSVSLTCSDHPDMKAKVVCMTCCALICPQCCVSHFGGKHDGHETRLWSRVFEAYDLLSKGFAQKSEEVVRKIHAYKDINTEIAHIAPKVSEILKRSGDILSQKIEEDHEKSKSLQLASAAMMKLEDFSESTLEGVVAKIAGCLPRGDGGLLEVREHIQRAVDTLVAVNKMIDEKVVKFAGLCKVDRKK